MLAVASWIFGVLASMIVGGMIGFWLADIGLIWGILAGGHLFTFLRLWSS
jgi:hypothetical protein